MEAVAIEQLLEVLSEDVRVYVGEHKPMICTDGGELAERLPTGSEQGKSRDRLEERQMFCKCSTNEVFFGDKADDNVVG